MVFMFGPVVHVQHTQHTATRIKTTEAKNILLNLSYLVVLCYNDLFRLWSCGLHGYCLQVHQREQC